MANYIRKPSLNESINDLFDYPQVIVISCHPHTHPLLLCIAYKGDSILNYLTRVILTGRPTSVKRSVFQERGLRSRDVEPQLN